MRKELIEQGIEIAGVLEATRAPLAKIDTNLADAVGDVIHSIQLLLKEALLANAVSEYRNRDIEMPAKDVAIMDIERLAEKCLLIGAISSDGDGLAREAMQAELLKIRDRIKRAP